MVLNRRALVLASLALAACLPKGGGVVQASRPTSTALVGVLRKIESGELVALPSTLSAELGEVLAARNLVLLDPGADAALSAFGARRATPQRLEWLAEQSAGAELLVLIETEVAFYSQLNGRFRWTVTVTATVSPRGDLAQAVGSTFTVPVFLQFHHERESEALAEASPVVSRQVGFLIDEVLAGL